MRLTVAAIAAAIGRFELTIKDPGIVRIVGFQRSRALVVSQGEPDFEEVPVLFVESSPEKPVRKHTFCVIKHGSYLDVDEEDELVSWVASGTGAQLGVIHVFEIHPRKQTGEPS